MTLNAILMLLILIFTSFLLSYHRIKINSQQISNEFILLYLFSACAERLHNRSSVPYGRIGGLCFVCALNGHLIPICKDKELSWDLDGSGL